MPLFVTSKELSLNPSARILSLTLIVNFKKDLFSCSTAIFKRTPFRNEIEFKYCSNFEKFSLGNESCAFIPSYATYILPKTSRLFQEKNNLSLNIWGSLMCAY